MDIEDIRAQRLLIACLYEGPYARLARWAWTMDRHGEIRKEVVDDSHRGRLAAWADRKDFLWRERYVEAGILPRNIWRIR